MRGEFAYFLGGPPSYKKIPVIKAIIKPNEDFSLPSTIRFHDMLPSVILLYADFIRPSIIGGNALKILKILPINYTTSSGHCRLEYDLTFLECDAKNEWGA